MVTSSVLADLSAVFSQINDPRKKRGVRHPYHGVVSLVFLHTVKLTLDQWSIGDDKTNEPGSLKNHLAELLSAYPALQLLTGDAIYAQRPLMELLKTEGRDYLFQIKANQPEILDALKRCFAEALSSRPAHEITEKRGLIAKPADFGSTSDNRQ